MPGGAVWVEQGKKGLSEGEKQRQKFGSVRCCSLAALGESVVQPCLCGYSGWQGRVLTFEVTRSCGTAGPLCQVGEPRLCPGASGLPGESLPWALSAGSPGSPASSFHRGQSRPTALPLQPVVASSWRPAVGSFAFIFLLTF